MDLRFDFLSVFALNRRYATERSSRHRRAGRGHARGICRYRRRLSPRLRPSMVSARQAPAATLAYELGVAPGRVALGMLLLTFDPPPASIWRWCSGVGFSAQVLVFVYMRNPRRRSFTRADMQAVNKFLFYGIGFITTVAVALQAINFAVWNHFWPFFAL